MLRLLVDGASDGGAAADAQDFSHVSQPTRLSAQPESAQPEGTQAVEMNGIPISHHPLPVRISSAAADLETISPLLSEAQDAVGDVPALLELAKAAAATAPKPGDGRTAFLWEILASVTAVDVAAGRVLEPHLDAVAILAQAGRRGGTARPGLPGSRRCRLRGDLGCVRRRGARPAA